MEIEIVRDPEAWAALVPEWLQLWDADPGALPFQRPEWLLPWWEQFGQPGGLRVVTIREAGGALQAMLPFYIYPDPATGERLLLMVGAGTSDYLDGVYGAGCEPGMLLRALGRLCADERWDEARLFQLPGPSRLRAAVEAVELREPGAVTTSETEPCSRRPAVPLRELPGKVRADFRFHSNAARGLGPLRLTVADESSALTCFDDLVRLHTERWQRAGEAGVLADPLVLRWHGSALPQLARAGLLRLVSLHAGPHLLGVLYALVDPPGRRERTQYLYLIGHSPEHGKLRPGMLLTGLATEGAASEGVRWIDMLRGDESYKRFWHVEPVRTHGARFARTVLAGVLERGNA